MNGLTQWYRPQRRLMPSDIAEWLLHKGSLTRRLIKHNQGVFSVDLLGNSWIKPLIDESLSLKSPLNELSY